jgi:AcrR family transcriptional regulator
MSPRARRAEDPILGVTIDLIAEHGVSGVAVDTVAATAGVSKATIYRHWGSRARLIHAAISSQQQPFVEPDTGSLRDDLSVLLQQMVWYLNRPETGRILPSFIDAAARDPELEALRQQTIREAREVYERVIRRGIERGELPEGVDVRLVTDLAMSVFIYRRVVDQSPIDPADIGPLGDTVLAATARVPAST